MGKYELFHYIFCSFEKSILIEDVFFSEILFQIFFSQILKNNLIFFFKICFFNFFSQIFFCPNFLLVYPNFTQCLPESGGQLLPPPQFLPARAPVYVCIYKRWSRLDLIFWPGTDWLVFSYFLCWKFFYIRAVLLS